MDIPMTDKRVLRKALLEAGCFERREASSWFQLLVLLAIAAGAFAGMALLGGLWVVPLLLVSSVAFTSAVMVGHAGGHRSLSASAFRNELMLHVAFPLLGGLGALYWKDKHDVKHHGTPNVLGGDPDIQLWPMAVTAVEHRSSGPVRRFLQRRLQGWLFWPLTTFLPWTMRVSTLAFLWRRFRAKGIDLPLAFDLAALAGHYALWLVLPSLFLPFWPVLGVYLVHWAMVGLLLSAVFSPAHLGMPIVAGGADGWLLQLRTTRDLAMPRWLSWLFVGLDHQVVHHLFPRMPHQHMGRARVLVEAWAKEAGAPYHRIGLLAGLADVTRFLARGWSVEAVDLRDAGDLSEAA